jgi:predicted kinase
MSRIAIVTGVPGAGKTSVCRLLAAATTRGLHLVSDDFYAWPAHLVDPTKPESQAQNAAILTAISRAAGAFGEAGYDVFLDGILGPWFLPLVASELRPIGVPVDYVVLRADADEAVARATSRQPPADERMVRHMRASFAELGRFERHVVDTDAIETAALAEQLDDGLRAGDFRLDLEAEANATWT